MQYQTLILSGSYFVYDFLCMAYFNLLEFDMTVHHLLCITGILQMLMLHHDARYLVMGLFVAEVSNPPMHVRILLRNMGLRYTRAYEMAEYMYFLLFFFGRVIIGHPTVYVTLTCSSMPYFSRFCAVGVLL